MICENIGEWDACSTGIEDPHHDLGKANPEIVNKPNIFWKEKKMNAKP
jgi:hypothetical protein